MTEGPEAGGLSQPTQPTRVSVDKDGIMNLTRLVPMLAILVLALTSLACPTRTIDTDAGHDSGSSRDGEGGIDGATAGFRDGQQCSLAADCASRVCTPFYVDVDGDGYGSGQAVGFCGANPPIGYAAQSGDCCDSASNLAVAKLIHPGADFQTTSAGGVCNITWDYDCSGSVESNPQTYACVPSAAYPACPSAAANFAESSCGTPDDEGCNCSGSSGSCMVFCVGHPAGNIIGCK
jgi:hypothetical protein